MTKLKLKKTLKPTAPIEEPAEEFAPEAAQANGAIEGDFDDEDLEDEPEDLAPNPPRFQQEDGQWKPEVEKPPAVQEWEGKDVFVAFPSYKTTNPGTAWCMLALALDYGKDKLRFDMELGDAMIYHARNTLAKRFLASEANWLLFVDDDMLFPVGRPAMLRQLARLGSEYPDAPLALQTIDRLKASGNWLVGATYYARNNTGRVINSNHKNVAYTTAARRFEDRLFECDWMGTGLMLINRQVFTSMQAKFPELAPETEEGAWDFFRPDQHGRGEDQAFCRRAREIGIQPYVDTRLHALHVGYSVYSSQS